MRPAQVSAGSSGRSGCQPRSRRSLPGPALIVALVLVLALGAWLRLRGVDWDEGQHLHPDERFLTMVALSLEPLDDPIEYFDTGRSTLNPRNVGTRPHYVYGTFPVIAMRWLADALEAADYRHIHLVGRRLSAAADIGVVLLVYLLGATLFGRWTGLLAAALSACTVLQIQLAHFFIVDPFMNLLVLLSLWLSVLIVVSGPRRGSGAEASGWLVSWMLWPTGARARTVMLSCAAGAAAGAATAMKLNAAPVALVLAGALVMLWSRRRQEALGLLALAGAAAAGALCWLVAFRVLQPYAFAGPGPFGLGLSQDWLDSLRVLMAQSGPDADSPPALQWARRPVWFSAENMVLWGLGPALGVVAWGGFGWLGVRLFKRRLEPSLLLWLWVGGYFVWQSLANNPTMRYQLPVYPGLAVLAAWALVSICRKSRDRGRLVRIGAVSLVALTLGSTLIWALAFSGIYTRASTRVAASRWILEQIPGPVGLCLETGGERVTQPVPTGATALLTPARPLVISDEVRRGGALHAVELQARVTGGAEAPGDSAAEEHGVSAARESAVLEGADEIRISLSVEIAGQSAWATAVLAAPVMDPGNARGRSRVMMELDRSIEVSSGDPIELRLEIDRGQLRLEGAAIANESSWDDGLPLRVDGYDPFGGVYQPGLNLEMYWPDNLDKLERILTTLGRADAIVVSSSRQWASIPRLEERYPLSTAYYRHLVGCPDGMSVSRCYEMARPGLLEGRLGFDLVHVETSHPSFGPLVIDDQASEEAFTVYDHPKVLIFARRADLDVMAVAGQLAEVDLDRVMHVLPARAGPGPMDLLLPRERLETLRADGSWETLFGSWSRLPQGLMVIAWHLLISLLGAISYPLVRRALPGLDDRGYALARICGLLMLAYLSWLAGSLGMGYSKTTITAVLLLLLTGGAMLAWKDRRALVDDLRRLRHHVIRVEALVLVLLAVGLAIRLANPDLWHPARGGEKPMELAYLNAVLKSSSFPPYDPWFAGGYLSYYYLGWVILGTPVKWLGMPPTVAFNLLLPTLLSLIGVGAFSVASNAVAASRRRRSEPGSAVAGSPLLGGLAAALTMVVLGNLATLKMVLVGAARASDATSGVVTWLGWPGHVAHGLWRVMTSSLARSAEERVGLGYSNADWFWSPTRIISDPQVTPITEFPAFSILFGDLHPHLMDLPLTLLVLGWLVSTVLVLSRPAPQVGRARMLVPALLLGALAIGALRPTNTWSFYPYLLLCCISIGAAAAAGADRETCWRRRILGAGGLVLVLAALAHLLYLPYAMWQGQGYTEVDAWKGARTTIGIYLLHWGPLLILVASWAGLETVRLSRGTRAAGEPIWMQWWALAPAGAGVLVAVVLGAAAPIVLLAAPLATWLAVLMLRPGLEPERRLLCFMAGTALAMTVTVELVVLQGDIGRMNTVFKLYLQAWTLLAVVSGAGMGYLVPRLVLAGRRARVLWLVPAGLAVLGALLYPILAVPARAADRMAPETGLTLDGMAFMDKAVHWEEGVRIPLDEDLRAIRWMQQNVVGSPVIIEYNTPEYRWGSRFSVYTGLPGVVGWSWHQRQQRAQVPHQWVWSRVEQVRRFYDTTSLDEVCTTLAEHGVRFIIAGRLERAYASPEGMAKLEALDGVYWHEVYRDGGTVIYEVDDEAVRAGSGPDSESPRAPGR